MNTMICLSSVQELIRAARQRRLTQVCHTPHKPPEGLQDSSSAGGNSGTTAEIDELL